MENRKNKRIGVIYEAKWEVVKYEPYDSKSTGGRYTLRNIYNGMELRLKDATLRLVEKGERSISWFLARKARSDNRKRRMNSFNKFN